MNKSFKGGIAAGAASLLLLGGAGTYALWSDSVSLDGGTVQSGQLDLEPVSGSSVWTDVSTSPATPIADISSFRVVPGDTLTYRTSAKITAVGDNLEATVTADPTAVTGSEVLIKDMTVTTATTVEGRPVSTITGANNGQTLDVVVTLAFAGTSGNASQLQSLDLAKLNLSVQQAR